MISSVIFITVNINLLTNHLIRTKARAGTRAVTNTQAVTADTQVAIANTRVIAVNTNLHQRTRRDLERNPMTDTAAKTKNRGKEYCFKQLTPIL